MSSAAPSPGCADNYWRMTKRRPRRTQLYAVSLQSNKDVVTDGETAQTHPGKQIRRPEAIQDALFRSTSADLKL